MRRILLAILYYIIAIAITIFFQRRFQSDSGPGLNIYCFIVVFVASFFFLIRDLRISVLKDSESYWPVLVHLAGIAILVYLIFFDQLLMLRR